MRSFSRQLAAAVVLALWPILAPAQEYILSDGPLSDRDFYNLVACAAPPGRGCQAEMVHWARPSVTVGFAPIPPAYPPRLARAMSAALDNAIAQINGSAPGITLRRVSKSTDPDILMHLLPIRAGDAISGTERPEIDGVPIGAALVQIWWDGNLNIDDAVIVFAGDIPLYEAQPILLEELTQSLGLMTDIRNPYYETRSVFSEDSNSVQKLGVQDRMALRRHYPGR